MQSDFTLGQYIAILKAFRAIGCRSYSVRDYLEQRPGDDFVILRHDVEWNPAISYKFAQIEADLDFRATYYFHGPHRQRVFNVETMKRIEALGHEVGYHYETLDRAHGDFEKALHLFSTDLDAFRMNGVTIDTICAHGNPGVVKDKGYSDNRDLFLKDSTWLERFHLNGDAYLSIDFDQLAYLSDVGLRFDKVGGGAKQLQAFILQAEPTKAYLLTHPDYWSRSRARAALLATASTIMKQSKVFATVGWKIKDLISKP